MIWADIPPRKIDDKYAHENMLSIVSHYAVKIPMIHIH